MSAESGMPTFRETVAGSVDVDEDGRQAAPTALDVLRPLWWGMRWCKLNSFDPWLLERRVVSTIELYS